MKNNIRRDSPEDKVKDLLSGWNLLEKMSDIRLVLLIKRIKQLLQIWSVLVYCDLATYNCIGG